MKCSTKDCGNEEVASGMCFECMDKHPGITKTIVTEENSYIYEGKRYFRMLGGVKEVKMGDIVREWN